MAISKTVNPLSGKTIRPSASKMKVIRNFLTQHLPIIIIVVSIVLTIVGTLKYFEAGRKIRSLDDVCTGWDNKEKQTICTITCIFHGTVYEKQLPCKKYIFDASNSTIVPVPNVIAYLIMLITGATIFGLIYLTAMIFLVAHFAFDYCAQIDDSLLLDEAGNNEV